jgi:hypothetical protein
MKRALTIAVPLASCAACFVLVEACSLVNTFEDLAAPSDATAGDVSVEAGADALGDSGPPVDAPPVEDAPEATPKGVIVIGGTVAVEGGQQSVLTALAPENGKELVRAREQMNVTSAHYDGLRDLWYIFESGGEGFFPTPTDDVFLHVRRLDTHSGQWTELQKLKVPPTVSFATTAVLRERLSYVAYRVGTDGAVGFDFITLDTSKPASVAIIDTHALDKPPIGAIGTRSSTGVGGVINLLHDGVCDAATCLDVLHVTVPSSAPPTFTATETVATFVGSPGYGSYLAGGPSDVFVTRGSTGITTATIAMFSPQSFPPQQIAPSTTFGILGPYIKPLAFAECQQQALIVETNQDLALYSIPLVPSGTLSRISTQHSGQGVYFEPFTSTVITPFSQGTNFALTAFKLEGTTTAPKLVPRVTPAWSPPPELRPNVVATRVPLPIVCN